MEEGKGTGTKRVPGQLIRDDFVIMDEFLRVGLSVQGCSLKGVFSQRVKQWLYIS